MKIDYTQPKNITRIVLLAALFLAIILSLSSCSGTYYIVDDPYDNHSTEIYYHDDLPYWGFYNNYYYYYGKPHLYPWWYYYTLMPHNTYSVHTHVSIYCNNGYYVSKPRGPKYNNNRGGTYKPTNTVVVKPNRNSVRPVRTNVNRTNIRVNTNKTNINRTNINRNNIRVKTNKTNIRTNKTNIKVNTNRNNVKTNKVNRRKPR